jgi:hypothetical protein
VIKKFYDALLVASGQVSSVQGQLGPPSSLSLRKFSLNRLPDVLTARGFLTHITSLDLSANPITGMPPRACSPHACHLARPLLS